MNLLVASQPPGDSILIRRATEEDAAALAEFGARTFFETFAKDNKPEDMRLHLQSAWAPALQRAEILDERIVTLLACDRQALAGFAQLRVGHGPSCVTTTNPGELMRFYVDRPWQGRGVAHALMKHVESEARERSVHELWLGVWERNERAQAFYRKRGFVKVGTQIFVVGTDPQTDHVMIQTL